MCRATGSPARRHRRRLPSSPRTACMPRRLGINIYHYMHRPRHPRHSTTDSSPAILTCTTSSGYPSRRRRLVPAERTNEPASYHYQLLINLLLLSPDTYFDDQQASKLVIGSGMATATTEHGRVEEEDEQQQQQREQLAREVGRRVSRLAVEGGNDAGADSNKPGGCRAQRVYKVGEGVVAARGAGKQLPDAAARGRRSFGGGRELVPPPHAWLAIEDGAARRRQHGSDDPEAEPWERILRGGGGPGAGARQQQQRRSSFSVVRRERAAREAWLDRAWEMKRSWHERNGGAPDADTPVVVVVGKAGGAGDGASPRAAAAHSHQLAAGAVGGGGVAMDVEEVRACRDLGLELPSDCTVEIQCYGLSGGSSPTHTGSSSGADSPCAVSSPGADPTDVKARLKVWAQAVALASTTHLSS
ncbi:hypothetical protein BS78_09G037600 [Paspalum vaginatum]|nr:hypothetical protein BS78_09G037600 [Paspalum vaginatum]